MASPIPISEHSALSTEDAVFTGRIVYGIEAVMEAIIRRLKVTKPKWYDRNYGFSLLSAVNGSIDEENHVLLRQPITNEVYKEQVVAVASVDTSFEDETLTVTIQFSVKDDPQLYTLILEVGTDEFRSTPIFNV